MRTEIINKFIIFSYILFALSLVILYLNKAVAIIILAASFGTFLLGGLLRTSIFRDSSTQDDKGKKGNA